MDEDHEEHIQKELTKADFERSESWKAAISKRHLLEWEASSLQKHFNEAPISIRFNTEEQPAFNRQF